jgi:hypothetical protein
MKTITLRTLLREPRKVKGWTRRGTKVEVTDNGQPLWVIQAAQGSEENANRRRVVNEMLDEVLREPKSRVSLSRIVKESRR